MKIRLTTYDHSTQRNIAHLIKNFSPSFFISYTDCPKAFYYKYIAKIQLPQKQIHLLFGTAFHEAVEHILDKSASLKQAEEIMKKTFNIDQLSDEEKQEHSKMIETGMKMVKLFYDNKDKLQAELNIGVGKSEIWTEAILEHPFTKEKLPIITKGRIDRMTDDEGIIELKTSGGKWNEDDIKFKWQTQFYGWMHYQQTGHHPRSVDYVIVTKQKTPQIQILHAEYTLDDYAKLFDECKNIINKIELGIYERPEGLHPNFCDCHKYELALTT